MQDTILFSIQDNKEWPNTGTGCPSTQKNEIMWRILLFCTCTGWASNNRTHHYIQESNCFSPPCN